MARPLDGKIAVITGASRGIGAEVAKSYAREGAHVVLIGRKAEALETVDDAIQAEGGEATLVPLDLTEGELIDQLGAALNERFGKIDILVCNAGYLPTLGPVAQTPPKEWDRTLNTNLTANYRLLRSFDPLLRQSGDAHVLMVTSGVTKGTMPYWGPYTISKIGLEALAASYAAESQGAVQVHVVDPGVVRTAMRAKAFPGEDPMSLPEPSSIMDRFLTPVMPKKAAA